jgi:hypothetical protein
MVVVTGEARDRPDPLVSVGAIWHQLLAASTPGEP